MATENSEDHRVRDSVDTETVKAIEETIDQIINTPLIKPYWQSLTLTGNLGIVGIVLGMSLTPQFRPLIESLSEIDPSLPLAVVTVIMAAFNVVQRYRTDSAIGGSQSIERIRHINESRKTDTLRKL